MRDLKCVGIIGLGKMGGALLRGLQTKCDSQCSYRVVASSRTGRTFADFESNGDFKVNYTKCNKEVIREADAVFIAVKPQTWRYVTAELREELAARGTSVPTIISIMAGIRIESIASDLDVDPQYIVRAMPNLPGQIGKGITVWTSHEHENVDQTNRETAKYLLGALGKDIYVESQNFLDIGTALSASGPAYIFTIMEALVDAGVRLGLPRHLSHEMVLETVIGSGLYVRDQMDQHHFAVLREAVTSPGGTTAQALYQLEKGGIRTVIADAVEAAYRQAIELSQ